MNRNCHLALLLAFLRQAKPILAIDGMALAADGRLLVLRDQEAGSQIDVYSSSGQLAAEWMLPREAKRLVVSARHLAVSGVDVDSGVGWVAVFALPKP